jgi:hypothetical protein
MVEKGERKEEEKRIGKCISTKRLERKEEEEEEGEEGEKGFACACTNLFSHRHLFFSSACWLFITLSPLLYSPLLSFLLTILKS